MFLRFLLILSLAGLSGAFSFAHGSSLLHLRLSEVTPVYERPSKESRLLGRFRAGIRVVVAAQEEAGWRQVYFLDRGRKRRGWIQEEDLAGAFPDLPKTQGKFSARYKDRGGLGLSLVTSYVNQKDRSLALSDEISVYDISSLSGFSYWLSLFYDWPMSSKWGLRLYGTYRRLRYEGEARLQAVGGGSSSTDNLEIEQSFMGLGATMKYYFSGGANWWGGFGLEASRNISLDISAGGEKVPVEDEDKPFFFFPYLSAGWDKPLKGNFYFVPEAKLGVVTSLKPTAYLAEIHWAFSYHW
jgi:hypothetical protein